MATATPPLPVPGPGFLTMLAGIPGYVRDPLGTWLALRREYGDRVHLRTGPAAAVFLFHPDDVGAVLHTEARAFVREGPGIEILTEVQGLGLATLDGPAWTRRRRLVQPVFHHRRVEALVPAMSRAVAACLPRLDSLAAAGTVVDLAAEMTRISLRLGTETLAGTDLGDLFDRVEPAVGAAVDFLTARMQNPFRLPLRFPTPGNLRVRRALADMHGLVRDLVAARRARGDGTDDLLGLLMAARDEDTGEGFTDTDLVDEVVTLIGAGHETTALGLTWILYLFAREEAASAPALAEARSVLGGRVPDLPDLARLPRLAAARDEALRLYPPVYAVTRRAREPVALGPHLLAPGTLVVVSQYVTHRHPDFWPEPERFEPARFATPPPEGRSRYAYFPFGAGPHACIGAYFAQLDTLVVLGALLARYRIELVDQHPVQPVPAITLRPARPIRARLHRL